jgi:hypothetical protein
MAADSIMSLKENESSPRTDNKSSVNLNLGTTQTVFSGDHEHLKYKKSRFTTLQTDEDTYDIKQSQQLNLIHFKKEMIIRQFGDIAYNMNPVSTVDDESRELFQSAH